jgi:hypothetical protein
MAITTCRDLKEVMDMVQFEKGEETETEKTGSAGNE